MLEQGQGSCFTLCYHRKGSESFLEALARLGGLELLSDWVYLPASSKALEEVFSDMFSSCGGAWPCPQSSITGGGALLLGAPPCGPDARSHTHQCNCRGGRITAQRRSCTHWQLWEFLFPTSILVPARMSATAGGGGGAACCRGRTCTSVLLRSPPRPLI